jgi:predicted O-methyltransferase YrrM
MLTPLAPSLHAQPVTHSALIEFIEGPTFPGLWKFFTDHAPRSLMSTYSRCVLFALVRMMRAQNVVEVGTFFAGTTEVMARALWENGAGTIHTADPFGAERCPAAIAAWPSELQSHARYYPLNSMDFFIELERQGTPLDLVLVDGNHDFEFALFDLQMAARLLRPGGIVVMDNSEQSGPFKAARSFLAANPAWRELGSAIASHDALRPFDPERSSVPHTKFIVLQAPTFLSIGEGPHCWGQRRIDKPSVEGLAFTAKEPADGTLFFQVHLRGFADGNRWVREVRAEESMRVIGVGSMQHRFPIPLVIDEPRADALFTVEVDLSWNGDVPLALVSVPTVV